MIIDVPIWFALLLFFIAVFVLLLIALLGSPWGAVANDDDN